MDDHLIRKTYLPANRISHLKNLKGLPYSGVPRDIIIGRHMTTHMTGKAFPPGSKLPREHRETFP